MIRIATIDDVEVVNRLGLKFATHSPYKEHIEEDTVSTLIRDILQANGLDKVVLLYEDEGIVKGMLMGIAHKFIYGTKRVAVELAWYVDPTERGNRVGTDLLHAFEEWAAKMNCELIVMVSLNENLDKYYERKGYRLYERAFMKEAK